MEFIREGTSLFRESSTGNAERERGSASPFGSVAYAYAVESREVHVGDRQIVFGSLEVFQRRRGKANGERYDRVEMEN